VGGIDLPAAVVVTTGDRLVLPRKQQALAAALGAAVLEIAGDHDAPVVDGSAFGTVLWEAVGDVARCAHRDPARTDR